MKCNTELRLRLTADLCGGAQYLAVCVVAPAGGLPVLLPPQVLQPRRLHVVELLFAGPVVQLVL